MIRVVFRRLTLGILSISTIVSAIVDLATPMLSFSKYLLFISIGLLIYYGYLAFKYPTYNDFLEREKVFKHISSIENFYQESWRWGTLLLVSMVSFVFAAFWYLSVTSSGNQGYLASQVPALHDIQNRLIAISDNQEKILQKLEGGGLTIDEIVSKGKNGTLEQRIDFLNKAFSEWYPTAGTLSANDFVQVMQDIPSGRAANNMEAVWVDHCELNTLTLSQYMKITQGDPNYYKYPTSIILGSMIDNECMKLPFSQIDIKKLFDKDGYDLLNLFERNHRDELCDLPLEKQHLPTVVDTEYESFAWGNLIREGEKANCLSLDAIKELKKRDSIASRRILESR